MTCLDFGGGGANAAPYYLRCLWTYMGKNLHKIDDVIDTYVIILRNLAEKTVKRVF